MRNPEIVLNTLCQHSKVSDYKFERLYRILFNKEMFFIAYQRIYAKPGNMTPGTDGQTIDQMSIGRIERLIETLRNESYKPHPAKRVYIPKKNGKKRPLGIPLEVCMSSYFSLRAWLLFSSTVLLLQFHLFPLSISSLGLLFSC